MVKLEKDRRGLGISLCGHKDRNKMAVYICGINPNGTAFKTGGLEVADEVIEVRIEMLYLISSQLIDSKHETRCELI